MDQGIITAFKRYYLRRAFQQLIEATDEPHNASISEFWKNYNILSAITNIKLSWDEVKNSTMNAVWKKIWPESCNKEATIEMPDIAEIVTLGRTIGGEGFEEIESEDILEVVEDIHAENMTDDDILSQFNNDDDKSEEEEDEVEVSAKKMTNEKLVNLLKLGNELKQKALEMDPDMERALNFSKNLTSTLAPYEKIYNEQKNTNKQSVITRFFQRRNSSSECSSD